MKASDVVALYSMVPVGAYVQIVPDHLPKVPVFKPASAAVQAQQAESEGWMNSARSRKTGSNPPHKSAVVAQNIPRA
jgi:hypothetical protein